MRTLIKNALLTDKEQCRQGAVLLDGRRIAAVYTSDTEAYDEAASEVDTVIDAGNKHLLPGFIDCHAHFRDPGFTVKEDLESGSKAALHGGYTYVNLMANTRPVCDNLQVLNDIRQRADKLNLCGIKQAMSLTKELEGKELVDIAAIGSATDVLTDDGKDLISNHLFYQACLLAAEHDKLLMIHPEAPEISSYDYYAAEELSLLRAVYFNMKTKARIHLSHISTEGACRILEIAKNAGASVTAEATPHHLALSDLAYRVNPPIRAEKDRQALIKAVKDGLIDVIGTDHAPHTAADKKAGSPGLVGLETAFSVCNTVLVKDEVITLSALSALLSYNPAQILQLEQRGLIKAGYYADLVLVDSDAEITVASDKFYSKSRNTPFEGRKYYGKIIKTIREGVIHSYDN